MKDDEIIVTGATKCFKPVTSFDRLQKILDECISNKQYTSDSIMDYIRKYTRYLSKCNGADIPYPVMMESDVRIMHDEVVKPITKEIFKTLILRGTNVYDRNGRMYLLDSLHGFDPDTLYIRPRACGRNFWVATKLLGLQPQSFSIDEFPTPPKPITTVQLKSVIYWNNSHMDYLKDIRVKDGRLSHVWENEQLFNYCTNDISSIDQAMLDTLRMFGHGVTEKGYITGPNFNEDKKRLERFIKKGKRKK